MLYPTPIYPTLPAWTSFVGFILGAVTGSFLNMLIWRLPRGKSLVDPAHSICPKCNHRLGALDLIPIVSWLRTGGKCRHCGDPIAVRYLLVELFVGTLFTVIWWQTMTQSLDPRVIQFAAYSAVSAILVAIIFIDWELYIIPDELNALLLVFGLGYGAYAGHFRDSVAGALLGWGLIWGFVLLGRVMLGKDAMGDGDVKMMRGVGALLGPTLLMANVGLGVVLGLVGGIAGIAFESSKAKKVGSVTPFPSPDETQHSSQTAPRVDEEGVPEFEATPIPLVLLAGAIYLFCIDILALFVKPLRDKINDQFPEEQSVEEDDWKPSATTIPFGPYLAAGALICMLAGGPIESGLKAYWDGATGKTTDRSGRTPAGLSHQAMVPQKWNKSPGAEV